MAKDFQIKDDEMLFFIDYNKTLVNYDDLNIRPQLLEHYSFDETRPLISMFYLKKCLLEFEEKTGFKPVICIVSNATLNLTDNLNNPLILSDFYNIFMKKQNSYTDSSVLKYFKYIICRENDGFFEISHDKTQSEPPFHYVEFSEELKKIRLSESFHKKESLERMIRVVDPKKISKFILFAGNDIKDDYPMRLVETPEGICKIFIRPGQRRKMTLALRQQFCEAMGHNFTSINKHGHKIKHIDTFSVKYLNENDNKAISSFDDSHIFLTQPNSDGLIEGIRKTADIIASQSEVSKTLQV